MPNNRTKLESVSWEYLRNNFHKFSEDNKVRICIWVLTKNKKPKVCKSNQYGWAKQVKDRDNHVCKTCGSEVGVQAHHIKSVKNFPELTEDINNGETLCFRCHKRTENYAGKSRISTLI